MTCKDCIHYDVCFNILCYECNSNCCDECGIYAYNDGKTVEINICEHFKDKSKYIELPCKVGDTVYGFVRQNGKLVVSGKEIIHFEIQTDDGFYLETELGKIVFFTKSEAEQKLKELNNER